MPSCAGLGGHHLGEMEFGAAQRFGDHHRHVIGGADDDGADGGVHGDGLAGPQEQLGGLLLPRHAADTGIGVCMVTLPAFNASNSR